MPKPKGKQGKGTEAAEEGKVLRFCEHAEATSCCITPEQLLNRMLEELEDKSNPVTGMSVIYYRENPDGGYTLGYQNAHMPAPWSFMLAEWYQMKLRQDHWGDFEEDL